MKLWVKIFIAMVLGVITGLILGENSVYLKPLGTLFLNLINMIIVLLIFSSMAVGITGIHDPQKLGRLGGKTIGIYFLTTQVAILLGLFAATLFNVGSALHLTATGVNNSPALSFSDILLSIIPSNPIAAMVNGNILQVIVFSVFLGLAINFSGSKGKPLRDALQSLSDVMYRLTSLVMEFSPIGVFGIMAWVAGTFGINLLLPLFKFLGVYYGVCCLHFLIVYVTLLKGIAGLQIKPFLKGSRDAIMMALSTCSSAATLPVAMHCAQENLGVSKNISGFVLPLGITLNMNGTAIFQAMSAVFVAQAYGISLDLPNYITLILTATLSAIGTAGVPGGGFIMLSAVLSSVGLPLEGLALLAGIDRLREMMTTALNIVGDTAVSVFMAKQEGELDENRYYHSELVEFREGVD
ncbi:MAG: dicarboxylate/amino acid:cation symporter [Parachlamydiaceae bacterium]|nr:dicarboxylate/amino acid:cation symporter [Parachlamydiaceae bacterium]